MNFKEYISQEGTQFYDLLLCEDFVRMFEFTEDVSMDNLIEWLEVDDSVDMFDDFVLSHRTANKFFDVLPNQHYTIVSTSGTYIFVLYPIGVEDNKYNVEKVEVAENLHALLSYRCGKLISLKQFLYK